MTTDFGTLGVPYPLVEVLAREGATSPFPIQAATLPDTLAGRNVLGRGRTGSGKTLAFGIPLVARLGTRLAGGARRPGRPLGLVLAPTRELATQIDAAIAPLAAAYGLTTTTVFGGVSQQRQVAALRSGVDIVVACPGRLEDLMQQGHLKLDAIEITVLDEADHMADLGFLPGVTRILAATPADGQRMLFSATLDNGVDKLSRRFLHDPVTHGAEAKEVPTVMEHHVFAVADADAKKELVRMLASGTGRRIMFTRTKHVAKRWARDLTAAGIPAVDLHGNLGQGQRDRNLAAFADGSTRVLVATDIAARGVHVDDVELVVHVDPPAEHKAYLHRSGRTARAGKEGAVVTVVLPEQRGDVAAMMRKAGITAAVQPVAAASPEVANLVGEVAAFVKPAPKAAAPRPAAKPKQRQSPGGRTAERAQPRAPKAPRAVAVSAAAVSRGRPRAAARCCRVASNGPAAVSPARVDGVAGRVRRAVVRRPHRVVAGADRGVKWERPRRGGAFSVEMLRLYSKQQRSAIAAISALEDANSERIRGQERQTPSGIRNTSVRERVRVLTEDEVEELVECYRSGDSTYVLSRRFGIGRETVSAHLRRNGVMRRANSRIDLDPEQRKRVIALYESRLSLKRVAEEVGVSERAVTRALDDAGIRRRAATEVLFGK